MIELIIGQNTLGKTAYLQEVIEGYGIKNIINNIKSDISIEFVGYNKERLDILQDLLMADEIVEGRQLSVVNSYIDLSKYFLELFTLMCKERDILILDEPDKCLTSTETLLFLNFISFANRTYKHIYIVTHNELMLGLPSKEIYTVKFNRDRTIDKILVKEDLKYEIID